MPAIWNRKTEITSPWNGRVEISSPWDGRTDTTFIATEALDFLMTEANDYLIESGYSINTPWTPRVAV